VSSEEDFRAWMKALPGYLRGRPCFQVFLMRTPDVFVSGIFNPSEIVGERYELLAEGWFGEIEANFDKAVELLSVCRCIVDLGCSPSALNALRIETWDELEAARRSVEQAKQHYIDALRSMIRHPAAEYLCITLHKSFPEVR